MQEQDNNKRIQGILGSMDATYQRIYQMVKQAPTTKNELRKKTNLPSQQLDKIFKQLSAYGLIKSIKRPQTKNQNVWVLQEFQEEQNNQKKKMQNEDIVDFILEKIKDTSITISSLQKQIIKKGLNGEYSLQILQCLKMKGKVWIEDGTVRLRNVKRIAMPCIQCKLVRLCKVGGVISPQTCPYLVQW